MAKGQHFTSHQRGIVNRYYKNRDTIASNRLGEIVSDLYLCDDPKKAARLWDRAAKELAAAGIDAKRVERLLTEKKIEDLAALVRDIAAPR